MFELGNVISVSVYILYLLIVCISSYLAFILVTTENERKRYRTKIQRELSQQKNRIKENAEESNFAKKLKEAGSPFQVTAFRYQLFRWGFIAAIFSYYVVNPIIQRSEFNSLVLALVIAITLITSPGFNFSLTNYLLQQLTLLRNKRKQTELFTLFDMLQAELTSLNQEQEINVYNLLKECIPYFEYIDTAIMKYLHLWKHNPQKAKEQLSLEIGGEDAEALSNILYKIDETSKEHAIEILKGASQIFSASYFEGGNRKKEKKNMMVHAFFFSVNLLTIVWLLVMIVSMFTDLLNVTNIKN